MIGTTVSHYELVEKLGEGGMGTVFKARDKHLNRFVALKFLRIDKVANPEQKLRLVQEARTASLVQHPNIVHIYDIDEATLFDASITAPGGDLRTETKHFIAMEFVCGDTLAQIISTKRLDLRTALKHAIQIADALTIAHGAGIIHRDLKPGNIMVNEHGFVKVLDFGLAKLTQVPVLNRDGSTVTMAPTTHEGVIRGTSAYMSPEQIEGKRLDARSDIFSFGAVLYEMTTGRPAFQGESEVSIMAAVLREYPIPPRALCPELPNEVAGVINRCLEKNTALRYPSVEVLRRDLELCYARLMGNSLPSSADQSTHTADFAGLQRAEGTANLQLRATRYVRKHLGWLARIAAGMVAIAVLLAWFFVQRRAGPPRELKPQQITTNASENYVANAVISPDGKYLIYGDQIGIHLRNITTGETHTFAKPKTLSRSDAWFPTAWFPDASKFVAVSHVLTAQGEITASWVATVVGGAVNRLRDDAFAQSVSPDGTLIAFTTAVAHPNQEIWVTGARGEDARRIIAGNDATFFDTVRWAPGGERLVYLRWHSPQTYVEASDYPEAKLESCNLKGEIRPLPVSNHLYASCPLSWLPDGRIVYVVYEPPEQGANSSFNWSNNLWEIRVDPVTGKPQTQPRKLTNWLHFCIGGLSTSGDGRRMAVEKEVFQYGVYIGQLTRNGNLQPLHRLTLEESNNVPSAWTRDSKAVFFVSDRNGTDNIYKQSLDQSEAEPVVIGSEAVSTVETSPDGLWILYISKPSADVARLSKPSANVARLMRIPIEGGPSEFITRTEPLSDVSCPRSPATQCVLVETARDFTQKVFTSLDPVHGRSRELFRIRGLRSGQIGGGQVSPNGSAIAMFENGPRGGTVRIVSLAGKTEQEIKLPGWRDLDSLHWASDGNSLFLSQSEPSGSTLLCVNRAGGVESLWSQTGTGDAGGAIPSPDGRYLAIPGETTNRNVWLLENF
jgi:eukaryotic-like serine/threonine-protein kinase